MAAGSLSFFVLGLGCAEGTQGGALSEDTLRAPGSAGTPATGGTSAGTNGTSMAGTDVVAGMAPMAGSNTSSGGTVSGAGGAGGTTSGAGGASGAGGSGGTTSSGAGGTASGGGGASGVAGAAGGGGGPTGFRYAKFVATSEQSGAAWSSCAELQILTTGSAPISRTAWTITADSEETVDEQDPASAAIDGDSATFWHTEWAPAPNNVNDPKPPHYLIVDMKVAAPITGFSYLPRQAGKNGHVKDWQFFVSNDGITWGTAVKTGSFPDVTTLQTIAF